MAKELMRLEIEPAENGGHTVTHHYRTSAKRDAKNPSGVSYQHQEPEHHVFGKDEGHEMLRHVAEHTGVAEPGEEDDELDEGE